MHVILVLGNDTRSVALSLRVLEELAELMNVLRMKLLTTVIALAVNF